MANISQLKKHQQFGFKLLLIVIIVGVTFSLWYFNEKKSSDNNLMEHSDVIPGNDLTVNKDKYLDLAKKVMARNYDDVILSGDFYLIDGVTNSNYDRVESAGTKKFWTDLNSFYGSVVTSSIGYEVLGNQVKINFETEKGGNKQSFRRVLAFGNYQNQGVQPSLLVDLIEKAPLALDQKVLQVGNKFSGATPLMIYQDGQFSKKDLSSSKNWKLLFFYPADFTFVCPTECLALRDNFSDFQKLGVDIYAVSIDLLQVHQAWETMYFGKLPYPLISDYSKQLAKMFGFWNEKEAVAYRGTVIISPDNEIKFMSAQSNDTGRNIEEYLRLIKAFQTPGLKPVNWHEGESVIENK